MNAEESGASSSGTPTSKRIGPSGEYQRMPPPTPVFSDVVEKELKALPTSTNAATDQLPNTRWSNSTLPASLSEPPITLPSASVGPSDL